jgi:hypothetical protein
MAATSSVSYGGSNVVAFPSSDFASKLLAGFDKARKIRQPWETWFDDCFKYAMPGRSSFTDRNKAQTDGSTIYDETAVVGVQEFASRIQSGIVPNFSRWADFAAGSDIPEEEVKAVEEDLDKVTNFVFEIIAESNFASESFEALLDLSVSCGALEIFEGDAVKPVVFNAVPMAELYLEDGCDGRIAKIYRERGYTLEDIETKYRNGLTLTKELKEELAKGPQKFVEIVCRDLMAYSEEAWHKYVVHIKTKTVVWKNYYRGTGSAPIIVFRWSKTAGETWGRGPLFNVLPAIKTCNLVVEMILQNAQMAISGIWTIEDDGTINTDTIELVPGTVIPYAQGTTGLKPAQPTGDFNVAQLVLNEMRANIKKGLYNEMLGNPEKTPMSATEVAERMADLARSIGSAFGRLQSEFVVPVLQRIVWILKKLGLIEMPTVNGKTVKVRATSPLAQAQNHQDILAIDRLAQFVGERFGPQLAGLFLKGDEIAEYVGKKLQVPQKFVRSKAEMKEYTTMLQGMAQSMGALPGGAPAEEAAPQGA